MVIGYASVKNLIKYKIWSGYPKHEIQYTLYQIPNINEYIMLP